MRTCIENLINGNLTEAKRQARRYAPAPLVQVAAEYHQSIAKAIAAVLYLKGKIDFQTYCDEL